MWESTEATRLAARLDSVRSDLLLRCATSSHGRRAARLLGRVAASLQRPPRIALIGEVNSGKTSIANALLGNPLLTTDVIHNTRAPVRLRYASVPAVKLLRPGQPPIEMASGAQAEIGHDPRIMVEVAVPIESLKQFELIDLPGLSPLGGQLAQARAIAARAHVAICCTVATQAWRASEAAVWRSLGRHPSRTAILAVTHADLLGDGDRSKVAQRLQMIAGEQFHSIAFSALPEVDPAGSPGDVRASGAAMLIEAVRAAVNSVNEARCRRARAIIQAFAGELPDGSAINSREASPSDELPRAFPARAAEPRHDLLVAAE